MVAPPKEVEVQQPRPNYDTYSNEHDVHRFIHVPLNGPAHEHIIQHDTQHVYHHGQQNQPSMGGSTYGRYSQNVQPGGGSTYITSQQQGQQPSYRVSQQAQPSYRVSQQGNTYGGSSYQVGQTSSRMNVSSNNPNYIGGNY